MSRRELTLLIVLLAVVLDAALLYGARRSLKMRGFAGGKDARAVHILGRYFPVLTWLKYLLSTPLDILQYLNHALDPELPTRSARLSSGGISPPLSAWGNLYLRKSARSAHRWLRVLLPAMIWTNSLHYYCIPCGGCCSGPLVGVAFGGAEGDWQILGA